MSNDNKSGVKPVKVAGGTARAEIARVSLKLPPVWRDNVELWFKSVGSQFILANVTCEIIKYHYVVAAVDGEILVHVSDLLRQIPVQSQTSHVKTRLIEKFENSNAVRLYRLLSDVELGDKNSFCLLQEMRNLAGGKIADEVLKMIWLQRLPFTTQQILQSVSMEEFATLACTADKVGCY